jgi:hypothetical protein
MREVLAALEELDGAARTADVAAHDAVENGERQVLNVLEDLRDRGVLDRQRDAADGRALVWQDDGLHRIGEHGEVELDPVDVGALTDDEVTNSPVVLAIRGVS